MKLAFYTGKGNYFDSLIRLYYRLKYKQKLKRTHVEIILEDISDSLKLVMSSSFRDGGVRTKVINFNPDHWEIIDVPWLDINVSKQWFNLHNGDDYDILGCFHNFNSLVKENPDKYFCSECVLASQGYIDAFNYDVEQLYKLIVTDYRYLGNITQPILEK